MRHVYTPSTTKHFSPIKQSTTLTNKHRGNEVSSTPLLVHCKLFKLHFLKSDSDTYIEKGNTHLSFQLCPYISWQPKVKWCFLQVGLNKVGSTSQIDEIAIIAYVELMLLIPLCFFSIENVINLQDEEGFTPLMWAAAHGQIAVVEFLLQNVWEPSRTNLPHLARTDIYYIDMSYILTFFVCIRLHCRVQTPIFLPKGEKVPCLWRAVKDTQIF